MAGNRLSQSRAKKNTSTQSQVFIHSNHHPKESMSATANGAQKASHSSHDDEDSPAETDLVIRDGFPALRIPGTKWKPMVDGEEPIPRRPFWAGEGVVKFDPNQLEQLREDCETVFTARDIPDGQAYSAGQTFFLPAKIKPRCALEALVKEIFQKHVASLEDGIYNPEHSGAEWWVSSSLTLY
jgi:hypothetical protein